MHEIQSSNLENQLVRDAAREMPAFGAESIKFAREAGPNAAPVLLLYIKSGKSTALLALEALREADFETYNSIPSSAVRRNWCRRISFLPAAISIEIRPYGRHNERLNRK